MSLANQLGTYPSVRPQPNFILSHRISHIILTSSILSPNEVIFDKNGFKYTLSLENTTKKQDILTTDSQKPTLLFVDVFYPRLLDLWQSGAKELASHFLSQQKCLLQLENYPDKTNSKDIYLRLQVDVSDSFHHSQNADKLGLKLGYISYLLLMGPIFQFFRRSLYGLKQKLMKPCKIHYALNKTVWIFSETNKFLVFLLDTKQHLYGSRYHTFAKKLTEQMKNILSSECKPYNLDKKDPTNFLYRSLAIIPKLRDELDFNYYNNLPPAFLLEWSEKENVPLPNEGYWFSFNLLKSTAMSEADLLSMSKIVIGLQNFIYSSFRYQYHTLRLKINAAAMHISSLGSFVNNSV